MAATALVYQDINANMVVVEEVSASTVTPAALAAAAAAEAALLAELAAEDKKEKVAYTSAQGKKHKKRKKKQRQKNKAATVRSVVQQIVPSPAQVAAASQPAAAPSPLPLPLPPPVRSKRRVQEDGGGPSADAATETLRLAMADLSLSKNELKKRIRRAEKAGADPHVVEEANRIKSTRLSEAQRLKAVDEDAALWAAMAAANAGSAAAAPPPAAETTTQPVRETTELPVPPVPAPPLPAAQLKRVGRITVDLACKLYASANSTVYMGTIGNKLAVVKVTRSDGVQSAGGENREETLMQDLAVSVAAAAVALRARSLVYACDSSACRL